MNAKKMSFSARLALILSPLLLIGCASSGFQSVSTGPLRLELKGGTEQRDVTRYYSHSRIHDFEDTQLVRERDEIVDFRVQETLTKVEPEKGRFFINVTTIQKDGTVDLHDLAFPEKGEEIEFVFNSNGTVLKAGFYPEDSVFFVPPVPFPKEPVQVGDTWTLDHAWVGLKNGIPLGIHLVAILKNIFKCQSRLCADVEVTGHVEMIGVPTAKAQFESKVWGRLLISVERGVVIWSEIRSKEKMLTPGSRTEVMSCMSAAIENQKLWESLPPLAKTCQPHESVVSLSAPPK